MNKLFEMAKKWIGVPFRFHGRDRNGCDCAGLIVGILHENKIISDEQFKCICNIRYGTNFSKIDIYLVEKIILSFFEKVPNFQQADLLLIKCKNSPIHFAIYDDKNNEIIHIEQESKKVCRTNFDKTLNVICKYKLINSK